MKYTDTHTILSQYTDASGILRAGALLRYMQESAANCMAQDLPSYDTLLADGYSFVLSKITLSIYADIRANDTVSFETWACESSRYTYPRSYRAVRDGVTVAEASANWALVDIKKKRLVRSGDISLGYRTDEPLELDISTKLRLPEQMALVGERVVRYSDIDRNMHMNNTVYADMICDCIFERELGRVESMTISFVNEAPFGESLRVYRAEEDGCIFVRTLREDGKVNTEARVICERL